jgi:hypothetical protein
MKTVNQTRKLPRKLLGIGARNVGGHSVKTFVFFEIQNLDPRIRVACGVELIGEPGPETTWEPITTFRLSVWPGVDGAKKGVAYGRPLPGADGAEVYFRSNGSMTESVTGIETETTAERLLVGFEIAGNAMSSVPTCLGFEVWGFCDLSIVGAVDPVECKEILSRVTIADVKPITFTYGNV